MCPLSFFEINRFKPASGQVLNAFLELADSTTGREDLILGSCQVAAMVGDLKLRAPMYEMTLANLFENSDAVDRALAAADQEQERLMRRSCFSLGKNA